MSVDYKMRAPGLSVSCRDSADLSKYNHDEAKLDMTLQWLDIWTSVAQALVFQNGKTCEQVADAQNEVSQE